MIFFLRCSLFSEQNHTALFRSCLLHTPFFLSLFRGRGSWNASCLFADCFFSIVIERSVIKSAWRTVSNITLLAIVLPPFLFLLSVSLSLAPALLFFFSHLCPCAGVVRCAWFFSCTTSLLIPASVAPTSMCIICAEALAVATYPHSPSQWCFFFCFRVSLISFFFWQPFSLFSFPFFF